MTDRTNIPVTVEDNYYQILDVPNTATLMEIRNAYEEKLEETHLKAFAAYSLFPEEETEEKLLQFSQAFVTLANPIARAKYDDELNQLNVSAEPQIDLKKESAPLIEEQSPVKSAWEKTETGPLGKSLDKIQPEIKAEIPENNTQDVAGQTQTERQDFYLNLAAKNELSEDSLQEYYNTLKTHGGEISYNGAVLQQIRNIKSITLDELAQITCIRGAYLKAIEEEDFSKFSSEIYLKGYLLCYVESMNLPSKQILDDYICLYKNSLESESG